MKKLIGMLLLMVSMGSMLLARDTPPAPEIDAGLAGSSLAFVAGALLVVRSRRKQ
jgi:hypothetical protein